MKAFIFATEKLELLKHEARIIDTPALNYIFDEAIQAGATDIHSFSRTFSQELDAIKQHLPEQGQALVFAVPMPLIKQDTLQKILNAHTTAESACTVMTNLFVFDAAALKKILEKLQSVPRALHSEDVDFETIVGEMRADGQKCQFLHDDDSEQFLVIENYSQLAFATKVMKSRINLFHMENGVIMMDPANTTIGKHVVIGEGTLLYPGTTLEGKVTIGRDCTIGPNSRIFNSEIGDNVKAEFSVILQSSVDSFTNVGPFAYVRPDSKIGKHCKIGDFVEVKNSVIGDGTKISHLTYVGDSDVGEKVNFGCGTVTVNYDGIHKARTTIKDNAFIGCNTNLIAPVVVQDGAFVAAGSTITDNVPENGFAIARTRQTNKTNWQRKK